MRVLSNHHSGACPRLKLQSIMGGPLNTVNRICFQSDSSQFMHILADCPVQRAEGFVLASRCAGVLTSGLGGNCQGACLHAAGQAHAGLLSSAWAQADGIPEWQRCGPAPSRRASTEQAAE